MPVPSDDQLQHLLRLAREAAGRAYAPYSRFPVGAALLTEDGRMFVGCNVENAAYPLGLCAERSAVSAMVVGGGGRIQAAVVYTPTPTPASPCGACRQVLHEFGPEATVYSFCEGTEASVNPLPTLLPQAFGPENLA